jgi:hypothetical protein
MKPDAICDTARGSILRVAIDGTIGGGDGDGEGEGEGAIDVAAVVLGDNTIVGDGSGEDTGEEDDGRSDGISVIG